MLEVTQLEFLIDLLALGERPEMKVTQTNADRVLAEGLLSIEDRFGSPMARKLAFRIINLAPIPNVLNEALKAAHEVLSAEVNMMANAFPGKRLCDRGPRTRHLIQEAETSQ